MAWLFGFGGLGVGGVVGGVDCRQSGGNGERVCAEIDSDFGRKMPGLVQRGKVGIEAEPFGDGGLPFEILGSRPNRFAKCQLDAAAALWAIGPAEQEYLKRAGFEPRLFSELLHAHAGCRKGGSE